MFQWGVRWEPLRSTDRDGSVDPALFGGSAVARTFDTPQFRGLTFYEIRARSIINRVPAASRVPFRWTINPYRGCSTACAYCFARNTHTYLDLDAGHDFETRIVVKVNAPELLRVELARKSWSAEHVAMGTNVDCYQRAEGRYRLMPGIIRALRDRANPFSILTKGALILRDLPLLLEAAQVTDVTTNVSVGSLDPELARSVEPGAPPPRRRLQVCARLNQAGVRCGVLMAPILPYLSDSPAALDAAVAEIAAAGATHVSPIVLHLRPGAREWFLRWLSAQHPDLLPRYRALYRGGSYADRTYQRQITERVQQAARRHGLLPGEPPATRAPAPAGPTEEERSAVRQPVLL